VNAAPTRPFDVDADLVVANRYELEVIGPRRGLVALTLGAEAQSCSTTATSSRGLRTEGRCCRRDCRRRCLHGGSRRLAARVRVSGLAFAQSATSAIRGTRASGRETVRWTHISLVLYGFIAALT